MTLDLYTVLVVACSLVIATIVYRKTAPKPAGAHQTSPGERLAWAVGAAAGVIVVGAFLGEGLKGVERIEEPSTGKPRAAAVQVLIEYGVGKEETSFMSTTRRPLGTGPDVEIPERDERAKTAFERAAAGDWIEVP
ncbi:hypothetical protein [Streptomyces hydrogenans]